jgi:hypothetical protein
MEFSIEGSMRSLTEVSTNYWAVLVAALAYWFLGALWYSVLFGKAWMAASGTTDEDVKKGAGLAYIGSFIMMAVLTLVMSCWVDYYGANDWQAGAKAGFWAWLGFVVTTGVINGLFERTKPMLYVINYGYHLVGCIIAGIILAVWQ